MKNLSKNVLYISKHLQMINTNQDKFFPFLNSPLLHTHSMKKITMDKIANICNLQNIKNFIPHKQQCQQFVFFGRSNVGKSSLINSLIQQSITETSKKPGKTKQLTFLKLNTADKTYLVDAPGYGYASDASKKQIGQWGRLMHYYLKNTSTGDDQLILVLIDLMHGLKKTDVMLLDMLHLLKKNFMIVFTKCDRSKSQDFEEGKIICKRIQQSYTNMNFFVHFTSSLQNIGIEQLRDHINYQIICRQIKNLKRKK